VDVSGARRVFCTLRNDLSVSALAAVQVKEGVDVPFQKSQTPMRCRDSTGPRLLPDGPPTLPLPVLLKAFLLIGAS
jgi:hypothetical protein